MRFLYPIVILSLFLGGVVRGEDTVEPIAPGIALVHRVTTAPLNAFFLKVQLDQPGVRVQPALAQDYYAARETVLSFAKRYGAVAAINGDYFGSGHGPEGLNYVLGVPVYEGFGRSAVNFTSALQPTIGLDTNLYSSYQAGELELFNCLGGGPIFMTNGIVKWEYTATTINGESFSAGSAWSGLQPWTAVGISSDRKLLVLAVVDGRQTLSRGVTPWEMGALLVEMGASEAIKLDGGGSSEIVVNGAIRNSPSDGYERPVANALLVFSDAP